MSTATVRELVRVLQERPIPGSIFDEKSFERRFVEPVCVDVLAVADLCVAVHPWGDKTKAKCWAESKKWASVTTWGMKHTFDLVARSRDESWSLAVEVKLVKSKHGKGITGDFQRMMGQCHLARLRHDAVVGIFGYVGELKEAASVHDFAQDLGERDGIWIVVRKVG